LRRAFLLLVLLFLVLASVPASAQSPTGNSSSTSDDAPKSIDLGAATFQGCTLDGDTMHAEFDADRPVRLTLYDAGVFTTEGSFNVPSKSVSLSSGSSTIEMPVTVREGTAALFIRSPTAATGCTVNQDYTFFNYAATWLDVRVTYIASLLGAVSTFAVVAYRFKSSFAEAKRIL